MTGADSRASEALQQVAEVVDRMLTDAAGEKIGFSLFIFPVQSHSRASYIGNCDRKEIADAVQKCLDHWRDGMPDIPAHEVQ